MARKDAGIPPRKTPGLSEDREVMRAKYLDYCSAQVADILLLLSPDEMYVLAQDAARDSGLGEDVSLTYPDIVRLATARVFQKLELPSFEPWSAEYLQDPERFDAVILGLWESDGRAPRGAPSGGASAREEVSGNARSGDDARSGDEGEPS